MDELDRKKVEFEKLMIEINELTNERRLKEEYPKLLSRKDTYWKFRNSYSCPREEKDYWFVYRRIVDVLSDGNMIVSEFQTDMYGEVTLKPNDKVSWESSSNWVEIPKTQWEKAFHEVTLVILTIKGESRETGENGTRRRNMP